MFIFVAAQAAATTPPVTGPEVVVTAHRYSDVLARCLAANCPPEQEVDAAMDAAAEQFRSGRYEEAMNLLQRTIDRNKRYTARMPGPMSDLYVTHADVAAHFGRRTAYQGSTRRSVDILRDYVGKTSAAALAARPRVGDMLVLDGQARAADEVYSKAAHDAAVNGQPRLAALITFRRAWLSFEQHNDAWTAQLLDAVTSGAPHDPKIATLVRALRVRMAIRQGKDDLVDRLLAEWRTAPDVAPVLVFEPVAPIVDPFEGSDISMNGNATGSARDFQWVDIGYWVRPSGAVEQAEILRPQTARAWAKPYVQQVAKRRYIPLAQEPGSPGVYRVERYSLRRDLDFGQGNPWVMRQGAIKVIRTDMTRTAEDEKATR